MSHAEKTVRIGCGSGFAMDRLQPAIDLAASGKVDYLGFDALAERTLAHAQLRRQNDSNTGYDVRLAEIVDAFGQHVANGLKIVGNFGGANVEAGADLVVEQLRAKGLSGIKVAAITGDDVLELVRAQNPRIEELGLTVEELGDRVSSANAYLGARQVTEALAAGAQWVIGGRLPDPSVYVGPIMHEMGWSYEDWDRVAHATLVGHLMECSTHVTGGYYAGPPFRVVEDLRQLPFPYSEVGDGEAVVTKLPGTGGLIDDRVVAAQVSYEVHDPAAYLCPDVAADFTEVTATPIAEDRVLVTGARGRTRPDTLKVLVGVDVGWKVVGEISYAAAGCLSRARLAQSILEFRVEQFGDEVLEHRQDLVGIDSLVGVGFRPDPEDPAEVRLRFAGRCRTREGAERLALEVERLYLEGPAGGGGVVRRVEPALGVFPVYLDADSITPTITYRES